MDYSFVVGGCGKLCEAFAERGKEPTDAELQARAPTAKLDFRLIYPDKALAARVTGEPELQFLVAFASSNMSSATVTSSQYLLSSHDASVRVHSAAM
eukprot:2623402-Amphidinium_carterae.1